MRKTLKYGRYLGDKDPNHVEPVRDSFSKAESNFQELYSEVDILKNEQNKKAIGAIIQGFFIPTVKDGRESLQVGDVFMGVTNDSFIVGKVVSIPVDIVNEINTSKVSIFINTKNF